MRKIFFLFWVAALLLVACNQQVQDYSGTYNMVSIDDNALPYAPTHQGQQGPEIVSGSLTLNMDGTFAMTMSYRLPSGELGANELKGTYTVEGSDFRLHWEGAGVTPGTLDGDRFTFNNEGMVFAFQK